MKEFVIGAIDKGRRLDKYIFNILSSAPHSFAYKMLRKKNIVLNGQKASGNEILSEGDSIRFYLSDDTFEKFSQKTHVADDLSSLMPSVAYEDDDIIIVNKPKGMLSQRSSAEDISLNEICLSYVSRGKGAPESPLSFTPSICNRLDRNTSGLVIFAKTYKGARAINAAIKEHRIMKYYKCIVCGIVKEDLALTGRLVKDNATNKVGISDDGDEGAFVKTLVHPIKTNDGLSLLEINLITGKTHQIRAHMASVGHPLLGDKKYGDRQMNDLYRQKYGTDSQLLVCYKLVFPDDFELEDISGRTIEIDMPKEMKQVML